MAVHWVSPVPAVGEGEWRAASGTPPHLPGDSSRCLQGVPAQRERMPTFSHVPLSACGWCHGCSFLGKVALCEIQTSS